MKTLYMTMAACLLLAAFALGSCNVVGNIPGNVAGQLMNEGGQGQGFIAVQLIDAETGTLVVSENADDKGNFMFKSVEPGRYTIKTVPVGGGELRNNCEEFNLTPGKTLTKNVIIYRD